MCDLQHVQIDACRIVHHVGIMFTGEDITGPTHIRRELINLIEPAIEVSDDGTIPVPTGPGIGVNVVRERVEKATERHHVVDAREVAR